MSEKPAEAAKPPAWFTPIGTPRNTLPQEDYMAWLRIAFREVHNRLDQIEHRVQTLANKVRA